MKRFYCTLCDKVKHVRVMPSSVTDPLATDIRRRVGKCRFHPTGQTRGEFLASHRLKPPPATPKVKKAPTPPPTPKKTRGVQ